MRDNKLHTPVGFRDVLPEEYRRKKQVTEKISRVISAFGYNFLESPMLEYLEVFSYENKGGTDPGQMYKFFDREGSVLAMRSDMTPPIARLAATAFSQEAPPLRFSYLGNTYKSSAGYQGKLYEIPQAGIELMGVDSVEADAEAIVVGVKCMLATGIQEFKMHVGQVRFFKAVLEETNLSPSQREQLEEKIVEKDFVGLEALLKACSMEENCRRLLLELPKLVGKKEVLAYARTLTKSKQALEALDNLDELMNVLECYGIEQYINFDLGMVNQLHYYTGIIFRGYTYGTVYSVVGGGRYDNLVSLYGRKLPAVGLGININEILSVLEKTVPVEKAEEKRVLLAFCRQGREKAIEIGERYREAGMAVETSLIGYGYEVNFAYAKDNGISHMLFFENDTAVKVVSFQDEMGGYTVETTVDELVLPQREELQ